MSFAARRPWCAIALVVAAPLVLAIVEIFHPHPRDLFELDVSTWMWVHYAQVPLFPLSALAIASLVRDHTDVPALLCRVGLFVFAVAFTAFDTAAGLVVGLLVKGALASGTPEAWRDMIDAVWFDPVLGGRGFTDAPLLALVGRLALAAGTFAGAVSLKRAGHPWLPVILLAAAGFGLNVFKSHAWPGGPLTFGGIAVAIGWLRWSSLQKEARVAAAPRDGMRAKIAVRPLATHASASGSARRRARG
jgi:hypothetical protein